MTGDIVERDKMVFANLSDLQMAGKVRMLMRNDLDHEAVCCGARDRIMYLSQQNERLQKENTELSQNVCGECSPDNYGWIFNRVEGKAVCGCISESEPFEILLKALERIQQAATGEIQIADDDTEGMKWIAKEALNALQLVMPLEYGKSV